MSELALLARIFEANERLPGELVAIPPGDDMALLRLRGRQLLAAVDQVVEGRHFAKGTPMALVGRKALARNLSDVAAMAGRPLACLAAATFPAGFDLAQADELVAGLRAMAEQFDCPLVGGDTATHVAAAAPLHCTVTVLADLPAGVGRPISRAGARPGDALYVTGELGGSLHGVGGANGPRAGLGRHLTFTPRVAEAIDLARMLGSRLHAMIDLSDGLARDAAHLAEMSNVRVRIDAERLPCRAGCGWREAVGDGEDYELCFAAAGPVPDSVRGLGVTCIGEVLPPPSGEGLLELIVAGAPVDVGALGWEHRLGDAGAAQGDGRSAASNAQGGG